MLVGGTLYLVEPMVLHLVSDLNRALEIKTRLKCPHIHFIIEKNCDPFTSNLVWLEVLTRGSEACRREGSCVISYSDFSNVQEHFLSDEDLVFFKQLQKQLDEKMKDIEIISYALGK